MKRTLRWLWLVVLVALFGLLSASCEPETTEDDSELPWSQPEDWEGNVPIGIGM
jgi:hypothetical protein